jgi:hypothetical protein
MRFAGLALALAGIFAGNCAGADAHGRRPVEQLQQHLAGAAELRHCGRFDLSIYGTNFCRQRRRLQSPPLQTTLSGVTINVTVNGTTVTHPLFYFSVAYPD